METRFSTRNAFYLRASNYRVIPLFLYLDERHVNWMTDRVLGLVVQELKSKMEHLLTKDRYEKQHHVFVERGEGYQYCYFLRKTTRTEVILLKKKQFSLRPPTPEAQPDAEDEPDTVNPRKRKAPSTSRRSTRSLSRTVSMVVEDDGGFEDDETLQEVTVKEEPIDVDRSPTASPSPPSSPADERAIKDWKPDVSLSYQGFGTSSVQLVLIVEPYPPLPPSEYAPPSSRLSTRSASLAASRSRSRTMGSGARYSSVSVGVDSNRNASRTAPIHAPNMRNATRSVSVAGTPALSSRRGGSSATPLRDFSATPGPGGGSSGRGGRGRGQPLFIPNDTPFDNDEEDEDEHEAYQQALREGRFRLPSVTPGGRDRLGTFDEEDENPDDLPEGMMAIGERLVHASEIEERVLRNTGGWEELGEDEDSVVIGKVEPGGD